MKRRETGFSGIHVLLLASTVAITALVATPRYQSFAERAKITEAFNLASESQRMIEKSYRSSGYLPRRASDANAMLTNTIAKPEFVREMKVEHDPSGKKVRIKVFFRYGVITNETGETQFIYMAGRQSAGKKLNIEWQCGASGLSADLNAT